MGLPPGTAAAAADSFVWMAEQDELAVERVLMLMRLLGGGGVPARAVGGAVSELQKYVGCGEPVLETKHMRCSCEQDGESDCMTRCSESRQGSVGKGRCKSTCGWNGTWLGMLYRKFSNSRLSLHRKPTTWAPTWFPTEQQDTWETTEIPTEQQTTWEN